LGHFQCCTLRTYSIANMTPVQWLLACCTLSVGFSAANVGTQMQSTSVTLEKRRTKVIRAKLSASDSESKTKVVHKTEYFGRVSVGSPAQNFVVVYDTGSGNLLIPGEDCASHACAVHDRFSRKHSSTAQEMNCDGSDVDSRGADELTITFGTGSISGNCMRDKICIGSSCTVGSFIASTEESESPFAEFKFDGVLGLAMPSMSNSPEFSLMTRMGKDKALQKPLFSVFLSDASNEDSEITFGEIKREHMEGELFWMDVATPSGYWEVSIDDIALDDKPTGICENCRVAVDTGTSELAGPSEVIRRLRELLGVNSDCSNYHKLPQLGFVMTGHVMSLEPQDYVYKTLAGKSCDVSLMDLDVPPPKGPLFVFGIPFLQKYYSVYDHENSRVGFAIAKHAGAAARSLVTIDVHEHTAHKLKRKSP